jgi:hypothetical protein
MSIPDTQWLPRSGVAAFVCVCNAAERLGSFNGGNRIALVLHTGLHTGLTAALLQQGIESTYVGKQVTWRRVAATSYLTPAVVAATSM